MEEDFFEIDFLDVESQKSGDAIPLRYQIGSYRVVHVVDGGYQDTGEKIINHIKEHYDKPEYIDRIIVSHPDGDHAGGLKEVLENYPVSELWMLRPWLYVDELIDRFSKFKNKDNLKDRLKNIYPNIDALEKLAVEKGVPIFEPFQGAEIGDFVALAPTKERYLDLVVQSERTPESIAEERSEFEKGLLGEVAAALKREAIKLVKSVWGVEIFSSEETSSENDMSIVQFAELCGKKVVLTGDVGRGGLEEAADFAEERGVPLPGIDHFQVPHHGSRRNVSSELLDRWLGEKLESKPAEGEETFSGIISAAEKDEDHPKKAVERAVYHRGGRVHTTEGRDFRTGYNKPHRKNWGPATPKPYPEDQEED